MSRVNDLGSALGIPAGATTLPAAMYFGCAAAEKVARPEVLKDIADTLEDPSLERLVQPSAIIERVFNFTFGDRHLSWKCVRRSVGATICFLVIIGAFFIHNASNWLS
jgi:hypothetical protein